MTRPVDQKTTHSTHDRTGLATACRLPACQGCLGAVHVTIRGSAPSVVKSSCELGGVVCTYPRGSHRERDIPQQPLCPLGTLGGDIGARRDGRGVWVDYVVKERVEYNKIEVC